jgi:hypothetical protein
VLRNSGIKESRCRVELKDEVPPDMFKLITTSSFAVPIVVARKRKINHEDLEGHEV